MASLWAPSCALAAARLDHFPAGWSLLEEAVAAGFSQPELFAGELDAMFGTDPRWPTLCGRIRENTPTPSIQILAWPELTTTQPIALFRLTPSAEVRLRERIPPPSATAWDTAKDLVRWVTQAWQHDGTREGPDDALDILDRAAGGEAFSCVEYSTVLAQALNALAIPARRVALRTSNHHTGHSRGHVVCEAWIDDYNRWIILDPQHGAIWCDPESMHPLGLSEVIQRRQAGKPRAKFVGLTQDYPDLVGGLWWDYFDNITIEGVRDGHKVRQTWSQPPYSPIFQDRHWLNTDLLTTRLDLLNPDLSHVGVGMVGTRENPMLKVSVQHPYAEAVETRDGDVRRSAATTGQDLAEMATATLEMGVGPGQHDVSISIRTPYVVHRSSNISYVVKPAAD